MISTFTISEGYRRLLLVSLLACLLVGIIAAWTLEAAVDDAFIVYRYVERFLEGEGLTFNDGEHVEGFTSILWTLLLSAVSAGGLRPHVASILTNYSILLLTVLCVGWSLWRLGVNKYIWLLSMVLFAASVLYFKVVFLGLELGLYMLIVLVWIGLALAALDYPRGVELSKLAALFMGLSAGLLFAIRPESVALLPLALLAIYFSNSRRPENRNVLWYSLTAFILVVVSTLAWRLANFGELLPNSVIAKAVPIDQVLSSTANFNRGNWLLGSVKYFGKAYLSHPALLVSLLLMLIFILRNRRRLEITLLIIPILWSHWVIMANGGDWMPYYRFVYMFSPLIIIGSALIANEALTQSKNLGLIFVTLFSILYLFGNLRHLVLVGPPDPDGPIDKHHLYQAIGAALNNVWIRDDILIPQAGGRIAYAAPDVYVHEPHGLTDSTLAHDPRASRSIFGRVNLEYSLGLNPAVIVRHNWPYQASWRSASPRYPENYSFYCVPPLAGSVDGVWLHMIIRNDRVDRYVSALSTLGIKELGYEEIETLTGLVGDSCARFSSHF